MNMALLAGAGLGVLNIPDDHELYDPTAGPQRAIGGAGGIYPFVGGRFADVVGADFGLMGGIASQTQLVGGSLQVTGGVPLRKLGYRLGLDSLRPYAGVGYSTLAALTDDVGNDADNGTHLAVGVDAAFLDSPFGLRAEARQTWLPSVGPEGDPSLPLQLVVSLSWRKEWLDPKVAMRRDLESLLGGMEDPPEPSEIASLKRPKVDMVEVLTDMAEDGSLPPSAAGRAVTSMTVLAQEDPKVEEWLQATLSDPEADPYMRRKSMYALVDVKGDEFIEEAAEILENDPDPQMRQAALNALEVMETEASEEALGEVPGVLINVETPIGVDNDLRLVVTHPDGRKSVHHNDVDLYDYTFGAGEWQVEARHGPCLRGVGTIKSTEGRADLKLAMEPVWPGAVAMDIKDPRGIPLNATVRFESEVKGCAPETVDVVGFLQQPLGMGKHKVIIEAEGYATMTQEITVDSDEPIRLEAALEPTNVEMTDTGLTTTEINFPSGSTRIANESAIVLDEVAEILGIQSATDIVIEGHTDDRGDETRNLELSQQRAEAVLEALVERGVDRSRLRAQGFGETRPVEDNATADGRAANRRVDFVFTRFEDEAPEEPEEGANEP